jgi:predicted enzyme related to lactoylglutathione lyase
MGEGLGTQHGYGRSARTVKRPTALAGLSTAGLAAPVHYDRGMTPRMYPVIHFELPAKDTARAAEFYEGIFGWKTMATGPETNDFVLAMTVDTDPVTRMPKKKGAINGGIFRKQEPPLPAKITVLVDDIHAMIARIEAAGGRFFGDAGRKVIEMPGVGLFATFADPDGNAVTIYQDTTPHPSAEQKALLG